MPAVTADGAVVERTNHLRYLGVHFDRMMTHRQQVNNSTEVQERPVSPEGYGSKGHWTTPPLCTVSECGTQCHWLLTRPHNNVTDKSVKAGQSATRGNESRTGNYPLRHIYDTLLPENVWRHCREWPTGKADSEIRISFKKQQAAGSHSLSTLMAQSPKTSQGGASQLVSMQGATTIHEDSAAYEVSTSSLTMEMEAVTHALRWIASRFSQIQRACYKKWKVEWEAQTGMCQCSTSTFEESCRCTVLDMPKSKEMTERIDWWSKQPSQAACVKEDLKYWRAW